MLSSLEKHWPLVSILPLAGLLASVWMWPEWAQTLSIVMIVVSVGMLLAFTIHRRMDESKQGTLDRSMLTRMIILDVIGILLALVSAMIVGSWVSRTVSLSVFQALIESAPQWAEVGAVAAGLLTALAAGVGVGWLVRSIWGRLEKGQFART